MNAMYKLPAHDRPTIPADVADRLAKFKATLMDEVHEIDEIVAQARAGAAPLDLAVAIADLLGDVIVYCRSEALKYGIPLEAVLQIIMDSNARSEERRVGKECRARWSRDHLEKEKAEAE